MREIQTLSVSPRPGTGKGPSYRTRRKGQVPGIIYGGDAKPEAIAVDAQALGRQLEKGSFLTTLFKLEVGDRQVRVIPRALQVDPVTERPVHVDFMRLKEGATVKLAIPVRFKGTEASPGLKRGGVLNVVKHTVDLLCPVDSIPEYIEGDVSELEIRDSLHISAFKLPDGVRLVIRDRDFTVASIVAPTHVIEEARAAAAAAAAAALAPEVEEVAAVPAEGAAPGAPGAAAPGAAPAAGAAAPGAAPAAGAKAPAAGAKPEKK